MSRNTRHDIEKNSSRYAHTSNHEKLKVKTKSETTPMPYSQYNKTIMLNSEKTRNQNFKLFTRSTHNTKSRNPLRAKEGYNLRQRSTADPVESQSLIAKKSNYPSFSQLDWDDSLTNYDGNTINIKDRSRNFPESPYPLSRRSHSAHTYIRDASPISKQKRTDDTFLRSMESPEASMDHANYSLLSKQHAQKHHLPSASHDLRNFPIWDVSLKVSPSNKLQIQKMDLKQESVNLSKNWFLLLSKYLDEFLEILKNNLKENIQLYFDQKVATFQCVHVTLVKELLENDLKVLNHNFNQQFWLSTKTQNWNNLIASLQKSYLCAIFNEEDFSKTYVCSTVNDYTFILTKISEFLDECPRDIQITSHFREFMRHNKKFSHLKVEETTQGKIWIRNVSQSLLLALKKEIRNVNCQSYLLDENQYRLLLETKNDILSNIENKFQVKGNLYQLPIDEDNPAVFQLNPLVNICCFVNSHPESIPVDSLIRISWPTPQSISDVPLETYECLPRQNFVVKLPETDIRDWTRCFIDCFTKIFNQNIPPVTIGIDFPETYFHFNQICISLLDVLQMLGKSLTFTQCYIILIVREEKMKLSWENVLKSDGMKNPRSPHKRLSESKSQTNSLMVKVVQGNLADQQVDVIVNSTNPKLQLKYGQISSSLLKKAGSALQKECSKKYPDGIIYPAFAVTKGYKLPCKYVIHGALPSNSTDMIIRDFVYECLIFTVKENLSSIAFPALGTGNLNYSASEVVQQIDDAFKKLENKVKRSLPEVRIILYSEDKELNVFYQLDNSQKDKSKTAMTKAQSTENPPQSINWIQFENYSYVAENLTSAFTFLESCLKQHNVLQIPEEEFEDAFFFKDLRSVIPNLIQQLDNKKGKFYYLTLSAEIKKELNTTILEVKQTIQQEQLNIQPMNSATLDLCILKTKQVYPKVKFNVINNGQSIIIQSLDWNLTQEAKYFLEIWLGIKLPFSVSKDRFNQNNDLPATNATTSFSLPAKVRENEFNESYLENNFTHSISPTQLFSKKQNAVLNIFQNQDICCLQTENGLIIKIYQGDLLNVNVEGIVNAANKWLSHGAGVARAIIAAAGNAVDAEGQQKLNGRTLSDGEVLSTSAGNLRQYKYIIHAVGPMYATSKNDDYCLNKLAMAVFRSLKEAEDLNLQSIALPALSSAIFGVPLNICTKGYYAGVQMFSRKHPNSFLKEVHFVDKNDACVKAIQNFFTPLLIEINEASSSQNSRQSFKNLSQPSPSFKEAFSPQTPNCPICLERIRNPTILNKCKHVFCADCIAQAMRYNPKCPQCKMPYGIETGNQPPGRMMLTEMKQSLPGYKKTTTILIKYEMKHPINKRTITREAYLPTTEEGKVVLKMLQLAFERRLIFTLGESRTTGAENVITWNDIHHKTNMTGGPSNFGYPDSTYFQRVIQELADHGITPDDVADRTIQEHMKIP